jgi:hypothetical protein
VGPTSAGQPGPPGAPAETPLLDVSDLDDLLAALPPTALGEALRRARRERDRPPTGAKYQRALE